VSGERRAAGGVSGRFRRQDAGFSIHEGGVGFRVKDVGVRAAAVGEEGDTAVWEGSTTTVVYTVVWRDSVV
jgi:hypothetical protein